MRMANLLHINHITVLLVEKKNLALYHTKYDDMFHCDAILKVYKEGIGHVCRF